MNGEVFYWMPNVTFSKGTRGKNLFNIDELEEYLKRTNLWKSETARRLMFTPIQKTKGKTKESKSLSVTPARSSVRRSTRSRGSESKKRSLPKDEFYFFGNLIQFLQRKLDWEYKNGSKVGATWVYIRGDSKFGIEGRHGVDYFTEEDEVVDLRRLSLGKSLPQGPAARPPKQLPILWERIVQSPMSCMPLLL